MFVKILFLLFIVYCKKLDETSHFHSIYKRKILKKISQIQFISPSNRTQQCSNTKTYNIRLNFELLALKVYKKVFLNIKIKRQLTSKNFASSSAWRMELSKANLSFSRMGRNTLQRRRMKKSAMQSRLCKL
jgi:hypothetical protein